MTSFSKAAWHANRPLYESTRDMPFNAELATGVLPQDKFRHYMIQDAHYLEGFARALALVAAKGWSPDHVVQFARAAEVAIIVERELHAEYIDRFGISPEMFAATELSPTCNHYVSFLKAICAQEPFEVGLAALLPCFWIYREVGRAIHADASPDNPYRAWIDTYAGQDFADAVDTVLETIDTVAADCPERTIKRMHLAYRRCAQLEWMFWDSAYRLEAWPV
ncbi:thiaminase II [Erythrobacter sp.]|uniref:thiaminase II n=1 Tax=Erythrobacter sp. TaxID=1042 RepID=UPI001B0652E5|nr:thiaminase II [Erythrobacter sp.]MBO6527966.1 thiaminase II [Erythrobacter sp.]MBO6528641.1 thiaminase II [Erythrobacter sp.]